MRSFTNDFARICGENSQARAILDSKSGRVWTYGTLRQAVNGFSAEYTDAGLRPGDRVFSLLPNGIEQFVAFLAAFWSGIDFCPISPLSTPSETRRFLDLINCKLGLVSDRMPDDLRNALGPGREAIQSVTLDGDLTRYLHPKPGITSPANHRSKLLLFTSGTTSKPKALVIDRDALWSSAAAWVNFHSFLDSSARFYNILPMSYLGGLFNLGLIPLACRGSVVLSDPYSARSTFVFWQEVESHGVNTLWFAPTILRSLAVLHRRGKRPAANQIRAAFLGMATIRSSEKEEMERLFGFPLLENFALSETTFLTSESLDHPERRRPGSVGEVLPWVELRSVAPEGSSEEPEIEVRTPFLFDGYLDSSGHTDRPLTSDGFFKTGDLGVISAGGTLLLKGRMKDIIKKGGYLVSLRDLEEVAESASCVAEAAAVGIPHDFHGESSVLCVTLEPGAESGSALAELKTAVTTSIAKFKWPSEIVVVESFPKTESGKTQKWILRSLVESRHGIIDSITI